MATPWGVGHSLATVCKSVGVNSAHTRAHSLWQVNLNHPEFQRYVKGLVGQASNPRMEEVTRPVEVWVRPQWSQSACCYRCFNYLGTCRPPCAYPPSLATRSFTSARVRDSPQLCLWEAATIAGHAAALCASVTPAMPRA